MDGQEISGETTVITGHAPVYTMREYYSELTAFSRGTGRLQVDIDAISHATTPKRFWLRDIMILSLTDLIHHHRYSALTVQVIWLTGTMYMRTCM